MQVAILLYDRFTALDAAGPFEVFASLYGAKVHFIAETAGIFRNDIGALQVRVDHTLADLPNPDIIVVPGGPGYLAIMKNKQVLTWLRNGHATSRWTTSVCTGALILGAAGLLRGLQATTHWRTSADLAPLGATYVQERYVAQGKIVTAAGVSAGIDMALFVCQQLTDLPTVAAIQLAIEYRPEPPLPMITPPTRLNELTVYDWRVLEQRRGRSS
ncbi:MAG: DJ-1/PfpI family protein [Caldilineaceae bacterium]